MGAHTHDPDAGDQRRDPDRATDAPADAPADAATDIRVAAAGEDDAASDPEPTPGGDHPDHPEPAPVTRVEDVRPRRPAAAESGPSVGRQLRDGWRRVVNMIATGVIVLAVVIACVLALHIVFVVFSANPHNGIVEFVNGWATDLAYGFKDLFVPKDAGIRVTVNYGLAAVVYLVAGRIIAGVIRRLG